MLGAALRARPQGTAHVSRYGTRAREMDFRFEIRRGILAVVGCGNFKGKAVGNAQWMGWRDLAGQASGPGPAGRR